MRKLFEPIVMPALKAMSKDYVAGETLDDAFKVVEQVVAHGHGVTICYWHGEQEEPEEIKEKYADAVKKCSEAGLDFHLSVKIPPFDMDLNQLIPIVENVRKHGGYVDFDSHAPEQADDVYKVAEMLGGERLGCVIPGRWQRSIEDAHRAVELGLRVRVVKGSWVDPAAPKKDMRQGYLDVIDVLAGRAREVGIASHDDWLIGESIARLSAAETPMEQELLYGLPMKTAEKIGREAGLPLRIYVPYGAAWLPYSVTRALTNPRTMKWLALDMLRSKSFTVPPKRP